MQTKVYLIRHGAAEHTGRGIFAGITDSKLVPLGEKQAHLMRKRMRNEKIDVIFSSPIQRAMPTAEIIFPKREIHVIEGLRERDFGVMENRPVTELSAAQLAIFDKTGEMKARGAETVTQVKRRTHTTFMGIYKQHKGRNIAIVAHNEILKGVVSSLVGCPYVSIRFYNASMSKLDDFGGRWNIEVLNDVP